MPRNKNIESQELPSEVEVAAIETELEKMSLVKDNLFLGLTATENCVSYKAIEMGFGDVPAIMLGVPGGAEVPVIYRAGIGMATISAFLKLALGSYESVSPEEIHYRGYSLAAASRFPAMNVGMKLVNKRGSGKRWMSVDYIGNRFSCQETIYGYREHLCNAVSLLASGYVMTVPMVVRERDGSWKDITAWTTTLLASFDKTLEDAELAQLEAYRNAKAERFIKGEKGRDVVTLQKGEDIPLPTTLVFQTRNGGEIDLMTLPTDRTVWIKVYRSATAEKSFTQAKFNPVNRVLVHAFSASIMQVAKVEGFVPVIAAADNSF